MPTSTSTSGSPSVESEDEHKPKRSVTFNLATRPGTLNTNRSRVDERCSPYTVDKDLIDEVFGRPDANATHHDPDTTRRRLPPRSCGDLPSFPRLPRICTDTPTDTEASVTRLEQYMRDFDRVFPGVSQNSGSFDSPKRSTSFGDSRATRGELCTRSKCSRPPDGAGRSRSQAKRWSGVRACDQYEHARHKLNSSSPTKAKAKPSRSPTRRNASGTGARLFRNNSEPMLRRKKAAAAAASRTRPPAPSPPLNQNGAHFARSRSSLGGGSGTRGRKTPMRNGGVSRQQRDMKGRPQWKSSTVTAKNASRRQSRQSVHDQFRELAKDHYRHIASSPSLRELASRSIKDELTATAAHSKTAKTASSNSPMKLKRRSLISNAKPAVPRRSTPNSGSTSKTGFRGPLRVAHAPKPLPRSQKSMAAQAYARSRPKLKIGVCEAGAKNFGRIASNSPTHRSGGSRPASRSSSAHGTARLRKTLYFVPAQYQ